MDKNDRQDRAKQLDDFWDISHLVPKKKKISGHSEFVSLTEINNEKNAQIDTNPELKLSDTVIQRFIPPHSVGESMRNELLEISYVPENSLIHKVSVYKKYSTYSFYEDFCKTAKELWNVKGKECEYVDFFSYSPQYNQLSDAQRAYYLWWRECVRSGRYIKTNSCYIYLYTYELININSCISPFDAREQMICIVENYADVLLGATSRYIRWISDYSLIHKLPPSKKGASFLLKSAKTLKEYFVVIPGNTPEGWAKTLLEYCCSYDYRTSKFASSENIELFRVHVIGALSRAVEFLSKSGGILSELPFDDCKLTLNAFEGAVCSAENRYSIDVEYCSFSRSHELRFLVGDIVKYVENKIRAYIFVKSRLTVYSLSNELKSVIDSYFDVVLPPAKRTRSKKEEPQEYDVLYDLPRAKLDITNAQKIEIESWETTHSLVEETESDGIQGILEKDKSQNDDIIVDEQVSFEETTLKSALGIYYTGVMQLSDGSQSELVRIAKEKGSSLDVIVDEINEIAVEIIGDILIDGDGGYFVIEDYKELL